MSLTPVIRLVAEDPAAAGALAEALRQRYLRGYRIVVGGAELAEGEPLALLLVVERGDGGGVAPSIAAERAKHADVRTVLVSAHPRSENVTRRFDHALIGPWDPPESRLYPVLDEQLAHWRASDASFARVRGVMTVRAVRVHIGESLHRAAEVIALSGVGDLMVIDDDNRFVGVLSVGDVLRAAMPDLDEVVAEGGTLDEAFRLFLRKGSELRHREIKPLVITSPLVVDPDDHVAKAAALMLEKNIQRLPVVKDGRLLGTVGRADVCQAVVGTL